jgi:hypothetical protein
MIEAFFLGAIMGAGAILSLALYLAHRDKPKHEAASVTPSALGLDMSGKTTTMDAYHHRLMQDVIRNLEGKG